MFILLAVIVLVFTGYFSLHSARVLSPKHNCEVFVLFTNELYHNGSQYMLNLVDFLSPYLGMLVVMVSKLLFNKFKETTIGMLSQISRFGIITNRRILSKI